MFNWHAFPAVSVHRGFIDGLLIVLQIVGLAGRTTASCAPPTHFSKQFLARSVCLCPDLTQRSDRAHRGLAFPESRTDIEIAML